jgi:hypothetical protein
MVQAVGMVSNAVVLYQLYAAGIIGLTSILTVTAITTTVLVTSSVSLVGKPNPLFSQLQSKTFNLTALLGIATAVQALANTLLPLLVKAITPTTAVATVKGVKAKAAAKAAAASAPTVIDHLVRSIDTLLAPIVSQCPTWMGLGSAAVLGLGIGLVCYGMSFYGLYKKSTWRKMAGVTATLLFMTQGLAQLTVNFNAPVDLLRGLSSTTILLALVGNLMMIPRALRTRDLIWLIGCTWGALVFGWGQLYSMSLGGLVTPSVFQQATYAVGGFLLIVLALEAQATRSGQSP